MSNENLGGYEISSAEYKLLVESAKTKKPIITKIVINRTGRVVSRSTEYDGKIWELNNGSRSKS